MSKYRRIQTISNPALMAQLRQLIAENAAWRLRRHGSTFPRAPLLRAAMDEAKRRNLSFTEEHQNEPESS